MILLANETTFRSVINRFLLSLSWDLRSTVKLRLDNDGRPMIYYWHSMSGQGSMVDVSGLGLDGFMGVARESTEVYASNVEDSSKSRFELFTN